MEDNYILEKPKQIKVCHGKDVLVYTEESNYSDAFGYEWQEYSRTYTDSTLKQNLSLRRLELNLGFPIEFLKDKVVLELGSGQGRFTEQLVKHAKHVITADMSYAIYHNIALNAPNLTAVRADINHFPKLKKPVDVVFCRGVLQHTEDPVKSMHALFNFVSEGGLVIFDVYKKTEGFRIDYKYFWRPVIQKFFTEKSFDAFLKRHDKSAYNIHQGVIRFCHMLGPIGRVLARLPITSGTDYEHQYPQVTPEQRREIFRNEQIDMLYSAYDQPLSPEEVIEELSRIGQTPYSYDHHRNHFRCRKVIPMVPVSVKITKNGVVPQQ